MEACPVDVISVCSASGEIRPLRMRIRDENQEMTRIDIDEILSVKQIPYVGVEAQIFLCRARVFSITQMFELKYTFRTHSWQLYQRRF